tara:strand:- start:777 stop:1211 length:435 start_codon:yes stop_codon:yes gene_type:complete
MKKLFNTLLAITIFFSSCDKDEEPNTNSNSSVYSGTYIGDVDTYINGVFHSNLSKTITLSELNTFNNYLMTNNIFMSTTCEISNGNLNIPNNTTAASSVYNVVENGTGTFNGNNLTIEFNQYNTDVNTGNIISSGRWIGTLEKQ